MRTRTKILVTILAAVVYWFVLGWLQARVEVKPSKLSRDGKELAEVYQSDNIAYFDGKLPQTVTFSYVLTDPINNMAETTYPSSGHWEISIAPKWMDADMTKKLLMLHEECHVYTDSRGATEKLAHGPRWRSCMLILEMRGAFRDVLIEGNK